MPSSRPYALGGSRIASAFRILDAWVATCFAQQRQNVGYLALALLRDDRANANLVEVVRAGRAGDAIAAAKALATFVADPAIAAKIRHAATEQPDAAARTEIARLVDDA